LLGCFKLPGKNAVAKERLVGFVLLHGNTSLYFDVLSDWFGSVPAMASVYHENTGKSTYISEKIM
jgi:hypothetical protein